MPDWTIIVERLREVRQADSRFLALYAMQCLWDRGVRRLERALAGVSVTSGSGDGDDSRLGNQD